MTVLENLVKSNDSTILVLIVALVVGIFALKPVQKMWIDAKEKADKAAREHELAMKEKDQSIYRELVSVVKSNIEVNTALKTVIESQYSHCDNCKADQMIVLDKVLAGVNSIEKHILPSTQSKEVVSA